MSMSKSMRERMLQKKQQRQEEVDKRRKDKEDSRERDHQLERSRQNNDADSDCKFSPLYVKMHKYMALVPQNIDFLFTKSH